MLERREQQPDPQILHNILTLKASTSKIAHKQIQRVLHSLTASPDGCLNINHGAWKKHNLSTLCSHIDSLNIDTGLRLNQNKVSNIPKAISQINMSLIRVLHLENNQIESIEPLTTIYMPQILNFIIYGNKIVNIRSFRRSFWPHIKVINISNNRIVEFLSLTQTKAPQLTSLSIQWQPDPALSTNCSWILKLETLQLKSLCLRSRKRMYQKQIYTSMEKKHRKDEEITIYVAYIPA